jgi:hypothetical protein
MFPGSSGAPASWGDGQGRAAVPDEENRKVRRSGAYGRARIDGVLNVLLRRDLLELGDDGMAVIRWN